MKNILKIRTAIVLLVITVIGGALFFYRESTNGAVRLYPSDEGEQEENEMYDGPAAAAKFEFERTKDPETGTVPRERLLTAIDQTTDLKVATAASERTSSVLAWAERGPTSDVTGPSNGNTRANNGLASGRIRAALVDANDATGKTVFVGGVDGGLWKTTDITSSPATWTVIGSQLSNLAIASIAQDPRVGFRNIMYFATGESYYNADAVDGNGVFKSVDGGTSWSYLASTSSFVNGTRIVVDGAGNVYLGTRGTGLRRSTNGGTTWTNISPTTLPTDICDLEISSTGRLHVVTGIFSTQGYRYSDSPATVTSATWTAPATPFPSFSMRAEIAVSGNTLYALPANGSYEVPTVYKSTDGGATWAATGGQPTVGWASGQGWYALGVGINPANANECVVGGLDNWKTTNGGATWSQISTWVGNTPVNQYVHADVHAIVWYDSGNKLLFGSDGGIFYSADKGSTIRDRNAGLRIKQFYSVAIHPSSTNYFLAGAQDNGVHQFSSAGLSSSVEITGGDGAFVAIDQDQPLFQFGSYVYSNYRRSTDGGSTWGSINYGNAGLFINPWDYDNTGNKIYGAWSAGSYFRWDDPQTGTSAISQPVAAFNAATVSAVTVSPYTPNQVYFGTDAGRIVKVTNASGATPVSTNITAGAMPAGANVSNIGVGTDDNNLIVTFSNYGVSSIWVTTNGGTSWTSLDNNGVNLPDMPVRWAIFRPGSNSAAYIATETGVWETSAISGTSTAWVADPTFPTVRTDMIKYRPADGVFAAATHGRGLWTTVAPTAAIISISGRVVTSVGSGIKNATVSLADSSGAVRSVITGPFGYYRFDDVPAGSSYTVSVSAKMFTFATRVITPGDDLGDLDFSPESHGKRSMGADLKRISWQNLG